ncbi:MAG TPA: hypothetical protein PK200_02695 [Spirochaetota bacterium]|nr:hypothetical protein [Spirochaetota bacterium]HQO01448.1 hypothetical protein [Spirochaetota bacterium]HQP48678.1 hypothetical protein [Spirochaetota bacterium]
MKRIYLLIPCLVFIFTTCATLQENLALRKSLANCKYEFQKVEVANVEIDGIKVKKVNFNVFLKITNTAKVDAALDHIEGSIFLDSHKTADLSHRRFLRINKGQSVVEKFDVGVPLASAISSLGRKPDNIIVDAKVYVNIVIGNHTIKSPVAVQVRQSFPIPYDRIYSVVRQKGTRALDNLKNLFR